MRLRIAASAREGLGAIHAYIRKKHGAQAANKYKQNFKQALLRIIDNPTIRQQYKEPASGQNVYKYVLNRHTIILYQVDTETITIFAVVDARTDWQAQNTTT